MFDLQHNIVTLIYAIKGNVESHTAQSEAGKYASSEDRLVHAEETLSKVYGTACKALEITKRLGFVLKNAKSEERFSGSIQIREVWGEVLEVLKKEDLLKNIHVLDKLPEAFPAISCRPDDFKEALYSVAKNALQAMGGIGNLVVRAQSVYSAGEEGIAAITISDTGPGIPHENMRCLFQPFFTTKAEGQGNGLGLYLLRQLMLRNRGRVSISSYEGFGTTVTLELPTFSVYSLKS